MRKRRKSRAPPRIEKYLRVYNVFDEYNVFYYRKIYYEVLDCITNVNTDHFDQHYFKTYIKLENFLIKAAKGDNFYAEYDDVLPLYRKDFDGNRFQVQLERTCKELDML